MASRKRRKKSSGRRGLKNTNGEFRFHTCSRCNQPKKGHACPFKLQKSTRSSLTKLQTDHVNNLMRLLDKAIKHGDHERAAVVAQPLLKVVQYLPTIGKYWTDTSNTTTTTTTTTTNIRRRRSRRVAMSISAPCMRPFPKPRADDSKDIPIDLVSRSVVEILWNKPKTQFLQILRQLMSLDFVHRKYLIYVLAYRELKNLEAPLSEYNISKTSTIYALQGLKSLRKNHPKRALKTFTEAEQMAVEDPVSKDFFKLCRAAANRSVLNEMLDVSTANPSLASTMLMHVLEESNPTPCSEEKILSLSNQAYSLDPMNAMARREILKLENNNQRKAQVLAQHVEHQSMIISSFRRHRWCASDKQIYNTIVEWQDTLRLLYSVLSSDSVVVSTPWCRTFIEERKWWLSTTLNSSWFDHVLNMLIEFADITDDVVKSFRKVHQGLYNLWMSVHTP